MTALADVSDWIDNFGRPGTVWYAKRLSANDTLATRAHQAGPYFSREFLFPIFPSLNRPDARNPDVRFDLCIDSHADRRTIRAVWYNNKLRGGTRNEARLTGFGGARSALLDEDSTGALAVFIFVLDANGSATECHVWVCENRFQEDLFEERLGPVEPKAFVTWTPGMIPAADLSAHQPRALADCRIPADEIPAAWIERFPSGEEIIARTMQLRPRADMNADARMLRRRMCEYEMFLSIEEAVYLPRIRAGFTSINGFIGLAQTVLQSRKSRSGNSLELHAREIMKEEGLRPDADFTHRPVVENGKRPDFLFPSRAAYDDIQFPAERLRMLAAKTTCKDRWRQVALEADRIPVKHLLTLQEGVSEAQFREMREAGVQLVVPTDLQSAYPDTIRPHLINFASFIRDVRLLNRPTRRDG